MMAALGPGSPIWEAAARTILHLAWVGVAIGLLASIAQRLVRHRSPDARHGAALLAFAAWSIAPAIVFGCVFEPPPAPIARSSATPPARADRVIEIPARLDVAIGRDLRKPPAPIAPAGRSWAEVATESLPALWLAGAIPGLASTAIGLVGVRRLRRSARPLGPGPIADLARALAGPIRVGVATSGRVAAPVLIGIVRPLILLPPSAVAGWPMDLVEMALMHELAHLRRRDNLVNLLQRVVESILFFHPATWMLSARVRLERERCCDRLVVARTGRARAYAECLASLAGARVPRGPRPPRRLGLAMAAGDLSDRIRTILGKEDRPMRLSPLEGLALSTTLAAVAAASITIAAHAAGPPADGPGSMAEGTRDARVALNRAVEDVAAAPDPVGVAGRSPLDGDPKVVALVSLGRAQARLGDADGARATLGRAADRAGRPGPAIARLASLIGVAQARIDVGDRDGAWASLAEMERFYDAIRPDDADWRRAMVDYLASETDLRLPEFLAVPLASSLVRLEILEVVAEMRAKVGDPAGNRAAAAKIGEAGRSATPAIRARFAALAAMLMADSGDAVAARSWIEEARRADARAILYPGDAVNEIVAAMVKVGDIDRVFDLVGEGITAKVDLVQRVVESVRSHQAPPRNVDPTDLDAAIRLRHCEVSDPEAARPVLARVAAFYAANRRVEWDSDALAQLACLRARAGDVDGAIITANRLSEVEPRDAAGPDPVGTLRVMTRPPAILRTLALTSIATTCAERGEAGRAREILGDALAAARSIGPADSRLLALIVAAKAARSADPGRSKAVAAEAGALAEGRPEPIRSRALRSLASARLAADDVSEATRLAGLTRATPGLERAAALDGIADWREAHGDHAGARADWAAALAALDAGRPGPAIAGAEPHGPATTTVRLEAEPAHPGPGASRRMDLAAIRVGPGEEIAPIGFDAWIRDPRARSIRAKLGASGEALRADFGPHDIPAGPSVERVAASLGSGEAVARALGYIAGLKEPGDRIAAYRRLDVAPGAGSNRR